MCTRCISSEHFSSALLSLRSSRHAKDSREAEASRERGAAAGVVGVLAMGVCMYAHTGGSAGCLLVQSVSCRCSTGSRRQAIAHARAQYREERWDSRQQSEQLALWQLGQADAGLSAGTCSIIGSAACHPCRPFFCRPFFCRLCCSTKASDRCSKEGSG